MLDYGITSPEFERVQSYRLKKRKDNSLFFGNKRYASEKITH